MRTLALASALSAAALLGACATNDHMAQSGYYTDTAAAAPAPAYDAPAPAPAYVPPPPPPPPAPEPALRAGERG